MKSVLRKISVGIFISATVLLSSYSNLLAEDIEIYNRTQTVPNVLFVVDTSGSMDDPVDPNNPSSPSRLETMEAAFRTVLSQSYDLLNVGFMDFRSWTGSGVDFPVRDVNSDASFITGVNGETYAELLSRVIDNVDSGGATPTVEALYEAALYFRGDEPYEGDQSEPHTGWNNSTARYTGGEWRTAGPHTYENGTIKKNTGWWCLNEPTWFDGSDYGLCGGDQIIPSTCENYTDQHCSSGDYTCTGTVTNEGQCTGKWVCTGTIIGETHNRCRLSENLNVGSNYITPIQTACTSNHIVLLSDGEPTEEDGTTQSSIQTLTGKSTCDDLGALGITDAGIINKGDCGIDLADYLNTVDQSTNNVGTNQAGFQNIKTHTIGFQLDSGSDGAKYLNEIAKAGGTGKFIDAGDPNSLVTALRGIVQSITDKPRVISRVATALDLSNLGANRPEVYMPMFTYRANEPRWQGNLKGYLANSLGELEGIGIPPEKVFKTELIDPGVDTNNDGTIDAGDKIAVAAINPAVESFWSGLPDGGKVNEGGVASILNPAGRQLLTENGVGGLMDLDTGITALNGNPSLFGLPPATTAAEIDRLIKWVNGFDEFDEDDDSNNTEQRVFVGDPLHTDPVILSYDTDSDLTTVEKRVAFFMTNEGILHGVDVTSNTSATELFGFLPNDLLDNLDPLQKNIGGTSKIYGLDGPLVYYQVGGLSNIAGNKYLFFGMRRGGMNYYALDVTNPDNPSLVWTIKGGTGDFQELGQTWSTPVVTKVTHGGTEKVALVFGGGYDSDQDVTVSRADDDQGRAVYIVDALNDSNNDGYADVLWSAGPSNSPDKHDLELSISNSIPGDVSVIDFDSDSVADRLYFADVGGRVWRVDLAGPVDGSSGFANDFSGYELANLADNTVANNRRFFSRPVAALISTGKLVIAIGSGNRAHPLQGIGNMNRVTDRFYTLYDANPLSVPTSAPSVIGDSDLQDLTGVATGLTNGTASGWRINLATDEKVFNEAIILLGEVFFTSYIPPENSCSNIPDGGNFYALSIDGKPIRNFDGSLDGSLEISKSITTFGIVPGFTPFVDGSGTGKVSAIFGSNVELIKDGDSLEDRFWTNNP